jgi:hypothetical protein
MSNEEVYAHKNKVSVWDVMGAIAEGLDQGAANTTSATT